jgi:hypothetical protein
MKTNSRGKHHKWIEEAELRIKLRKIATEERIQQFKQMGYTLEVNDDRESIRKQREKIPRLEKIFEQNPK